MRFVLHARDITESTNLDARAGRHGDVFTAAMQTAGRGRLDHRWHSAPGENLMMSAVFGVAGIAPETVAAFPLVVGLAVARALTEVFEDAAVRPRVAVKWPNDVFADGRKVAGILCERHEDNIIAGIGVNVLQRTFPPEIAARATSLALVAPHVRWRVDAVRDAVLAQLGALCGAWRADGFAPLLPLLAPFDLLRGKVVAIRQTDDDAEPIRGICGGIRPDGTLDVGGRAVYAGEAHVESVREGTAGDARS